MNGHVIQPDINIAYLCLIKGEDIYVFDDSGKKYLDTASGVEVMGLGNDRKDLSEAFKLTRP